MEVQWDLICYKSSLGEGTCVRDETSSFKYVMHCFFLFAVAGSPFCPALRFTHFVKYFWGSVCLSFIVSVNSLHHLFLCIRRHAHFARFSVYCTPSPRPFLCPLYRTLLQYDVWTHSLDLRHLSSVLPVILMSICSLWVAACDNRPMLTGKHRITSGVPCETLKPLPLKLLVLGNSWPAAAQCCCVGSATTRMAAKWWCCRTRRCTISDVATGSVPLNRVNTTGIIEGGGCSGRSFECMRVPWIFLLEV